MSYGKSKTPKIVGEWSDDLIWCPSQCYLKIRCRRRHFMLYLRWRHSNPWTASVVECKTNSNWNMHSINNGWHELDIDDYADYELEGLKKHALSVAKKFIIKLTAN